ncbi:hypothetical protein D3OALGA1CA_4404 [Olavius algarvensis associated proteobacterium Delta 3]|nr:hypothetical protein D3OALGA1CA_4404 [Olavius algarvensis associated proteobacterium Delta 3]CAB5162464.1 hypothetical protein D3OALGB2SA_5515 [Olavius algarvensis associated proteobacterium Delta 3]
MRKKYRILILFGLCTLAFLIQWSAAGNNLFAARDPASLQAQAIERIERYIDNFRRTGDQESLGFELKKAEKELLFTYDLFMAQEDHKKAALSSIKLGQVYRMQGLWLAASDFYRTAGKLATSEGKKDPAAEALVAEALIGLARTEFYGFQSYENAKRTITRALTLTVKPEDKSKHFEALELLSQIQAQSGNLSEANNTIETAFIHSGQVKNQKILYYGHIDKAEILLKLADECRQRKQLECYQNYLRRAGFEYEKALKISQKFEFHYLTETVEFFLQEINMKRRVIQKK